MKKLYFILASWLSLAASAQQERLARNAFLGNEIQIVFDQASITKPSPKFHSSFRPYLNSTYTTFRDSLLPFRIFPFQFTAPLTDSAGRKRNLRSELMPLLDFQSGYDALLRSSRISASGGVHIKLHYGLRTTLAITGLAGRIQLPFFNDTVLGGKRIIPEFGQGYGDNRQGYHVFDYTGYLSYTTKNRVFNLQAGRDKHFVGDGYRSVLLSDYAPAYPYFRINANVWKLQYSVWYSWMFDVSDSRGIVREFRNKYGTFHYLSCNLFKEFSVGIFENILWRGTDTNQTRNFEVNYLNPVIFFRPQEYSVGSPDNSFIGLNLNATLFRSFRLYGQLGLDEFFLREIRARRGWWANKQAWQIGFKHVNAFSLKGLSLQAEYNEARPYTYSHGLSDQNYSHYGMPLAHPFGANFREVQCILNYRVKRSGFFVQVMAAMVGRDSSSASASMGQDLFRSYTARPYEYGHFTGQGNRQDVRQLHVRYSYLVVPELNCRAELGWIQRSENTAMGYRLENPFIYIALRSTFWNSYRDQ